MKNIKKKHPVKSAPVLSLKDIQNIFQEVPPEDMHLFEDDESEEFFDRGVREYKNEIDWEQFNEDQIQTLLAILFNSIDYSVEHLHEADRAREDGADLIVKNSRDGIAIAVKIKPKNEDRPQLLDLSKRKENKKIYVHIQTPSGKFREYMDEFEGKVEFFNQKKLNNFFIDRNLGLACSLIFDGHELSNRILQCQQMLFTLREKSLKAGIKPTNKLDYQSFKLLFRLKDEAVSLNKPNENVLALLEKPINIKNAQLDEHFLTICQKYMGMLDTTLSWFMRNFEKFYKLNKNLVHNSIIKNNERSHWKHLAQYRSDNSLSSLQQELRQEIKSGEILKEMKKRSPDKGIEKYWKENAKNNDVWSVMEARVRSLNIFGEGVEAIVDDIVDEYADNYLA